MIFDKQGLFSEDQAITVTADSTNVIDLGADASLVPSPNYKDTPIIVQVTTAFAGGTSIKVTLETDDNTAFNSATTLYETAAVAAATATTGYKFKIPALPFEDVERYVQLAYTVVGTMSAGKVFAGFVLDKQQGV